jgi:hypothetical protein
LNTDFDNEISKVPKYKTGFWGLIRRWWKSRSLPAPPAGRRWIVFDVGRVAFLAPADYTTHREPDETVVVYPPGKESGITLRFSLHPQSLHSRFPADTAERFVIEQAESRGLTLTRLGDRVFLTESRELDWPDRKVLVHYWQVGAGRILVVCSATIWGADRKSETVRRGLEEMRRGIESVRIV